MSVKDKSKRKGRVRGWEWGRRRGGRGGGEEGEEVEAEGEGEEGEEVEAEGEGEEGEEGEVEGKGEAIVEAKAKYILKYLHVEQCIQLLLTSAGEIRNQTLLGVRWGLCIYKALYT